MELHKEQYMEYSFPIPDIQPTSQESRVSVTEENPIEAAVEHYFQQYSPATVRAYKSDLQCWWNFSHKDVHQANEHDVLQYIKFLESNGFRNSTINRKLAALSKIFAVYIALGIAKRNPVQQLASTTRVYKPIETEMYKVVSKQDVEAVVGHARRQTAIIVKFLANTGLRISELTGIRKTDLEAHDLKFMKARILGKGKKVRYIFFTYALYEEVKAVFNTDSEFLFTSRTGKPLSRINLYKQIKTAFLKYATKPNTSCHALRHFFATEKIAVEKKDIKAVSKYLGHSSIKTTLDRYVLNALKPEECQIL